LGLQLFVIFLGGKETTEQTHDYIFVWGVGTTYDYKLMSNLLYGYSLWFLWPNLFLVKQFLN